MNGVESIKSMGTEELFRLCTRYLMHRGLRITSVKREDDIWIETTSPESDTKEVLYIKKGDLNPGDVRSLPKDTKTKVVTLGENKAIDDLKGHENIELINLSEFAEYIRVPEGVMEKPIDRALPSITEVERILKEAQDRYSKGDHQGALNIYSKILSMKSTLAPVWAAKGEAHRALKDYDSALECYKNALQHDVKNGKYWFNMGTLLYLLERHEEEVECYEMAIKNEPSLMEAWNNKGTALYKLERYEDAILCYDVVLKNDPRNELAWNNKGLALKKLDRKEDAIECFDKASTLNESFVDAVVNKGILLYELKNYRDALECFDKVLKLREDSNVLYHQGMTMYKLKDYEGAVAHLKKASNDIPKAKSVLRKIEKLVKKGGDKKERIKKDYPCFGDYEAGDKGCQACKVKSECEKVSS